MQGFGTVYVIAAAACRVLFHRDILAVLSMYERHLTQGLLSIGIAIFGIKSPQVAKSSRSIYSIDAHNLRLGVSK